jgi:hypothetical protein
MELHINKKVHDITYKFELICHRSLAELILPASCILQECGGDH